MATWLTIYFKTFREIKKNSNNCQNFSRESSINKQNSNPLRPFKTHTLRTAAEKYGMVNGFGQPKSGRDRGMSFAHVPIWGFSGWTTSNREVKISHCRRIVKEASIGRVVAKPGGTGQATRLRSDGRKCNWKHLYDRYVGYVIPFWLLWIECVQTHVWSEWEWGCGKMRAKNTFCRVSLSTKILRFSSSKRLRQGPVVSLLERWETYLLVLTNQ